MRPDRRGACRSGCFVPFYAILECYHGCSWTCQHAGAAAASVGRSRDPVPLSGRFLTKLCFPGPRNGMLRQLWNSPLSARNSKLGQRGGVRFVGRKENNSTTQHYAPSAVAMWRSLFPRSETSWLKQSLGYLLTLVLFSSGGLKHLAGRAMRT